MEEAIRLGKAVKYSAGTVEFIGDEQRNFSRNEHEITSRTPCHRAISGIDLLCEMIMIAVEKPLRYTQKDIKIDGWLSKIVYTQRIRVIFYQQLVV